ncbi:kinesin-like protein KIN-UA [Tanacetum coccineum]
MSQLKRLKLRKNSWDSDSCEFNEVLTEFAFQKRVHEVVVKRVVKALIWEFPDVVWSNGAAIDPVTM